jgi:hypothetical protein
MPVGNVGRAAVNSVGASGLAAKAANSIAQTIDAVGISGEGAKDYVEVEIRREFESISCKSGNVEIVLNIADITWVGDYDQLGVDDVIKYEDKTYSSSFDFPANCDFGSLTYYTDHTACIFFDNTDGDTVEINASNSECAQP